MRTIRVAGTLARAIRRLSLPRQGCQQHNNTTTRTWAAERPADTVRAWRGYNPTLAHYRTHGGSRFQAHAESGAGLLGRVGRLGPRRHGFIHLCRCAGARAARAAPPIG